MAERYDPKVLEAAAAARMIRERQKWEDARDRAEGNSRARGVYVPKDDPLYFSKAEQLALAKEKEAEIKELTDSMDAADAARAAGDYARADALDARAAALWQASNSSYVQAVMSDSGNNTQSALQHQQLMVGFNKDVKAELALAEGKLPLDVEMDEGFQRAAEKFMLPDLPPVDRAQAYAEATRGKSRKEVQAIAKYFQDTLGVQGPGIMETVAADLDALEQTTGADASATGTPGGLGEGLIASSGSEYSSRGGRLVKPVGGKGLGSQLMEDLAVANNYKPDEAKLAELKDKEETSEAIITKRQGGGNAAKKAEAVWADVLGITEISDALAKGTMTNELAQKAGARLDDIEKRTKERIATAETELKAIQDKPLGRESERMKQEWLAKPETQDVLRQLGITDADAGVKLLGKEGSRAARDERATSIHSGKAALREMRKGTFEAPDTQQVKDVTLEPAGDFAKTHPVTSTPVSVGSQGIQAPSGTAEQPAQPVAPKPEETARAERLKETRKKAILARQGLDQLAATGQLSPT